MLWRASPHGVEKTLALAIAAAVLFLVAIGFPIVGLNLQGNEIIATLPDAIRTLWRDDMRSLAAIVAFTTIVVPGAEIAGIIYLTLPLDFGRVPRGGAFVLRVLHAIEPWGMVSVFMLGVIVSLVKLAHLAHLELGIALWSFAGLMLAMAGVAASFNPHAVWERLAASKCP